MKVLIKQGRLIDPALKLDVVKDLLIEDGIISAIEDLIEPDEKTEVIDAHDMIVMPAALDMHAHLREPGFEYKETVLSGSWAAIKGGFAAITCMPNTNPVADNRSVIEYILGKAHDAPAKVYPFGSISKGLEGRELSEMSEMAAVGVRAFSDDGRGVQSSSLLRKAMDYSKMLDTLIVSHCEEESISSGCVHEGIASTSLGIPGQPAQAESIAVNRDIELAKLTGCRLHICHLSCAESVDRVRRAKQDGISVTAEVTPHHLFFTEEDISFNYDTNKKINPPLRSSADQKALIEGVVDGTIDCIATDHAPHASHEKECEFELSSYGSIGFETALPAVYTKLVETGFIDVAKFVEIVSVNPRRILGLEEIRIEVGGIADITVFNPRKSTEFNTELIVSKSKNSAFLDCSLIGSIEAVLVDGIIRLREGELVYA